MLALCLVGCSASPLDSVRVGGGPGQTRSVEFDAPLKVDEVAIRKLRSGSGPRLVEGDAILMTMDLFRGSDGAPIEAPFTEGPGQVIHLNQSFRDQVPQLYEALLDAEEGAALAYSSPQTAGAAGDDATAVEIYEVARKVPTRVEGPMRGSPEGLPAVIDGPQGEPTIGDLPPRASEELVSEYLIEGDGETIEPTDTVIAHYVGVRWADGQIIDSSYDRDAPAAVSLDKAIPGWQEGLIGKKTDSRVIVSVPAQQAYGTEDDLGEDSPFPAGDLLFVIDILATAGAATAATAPPLSPTSSSEHSAP